MPESQRRTELPDYKIVFYSQSNGLHSSSSLTQVIRDVPSIPCRYTYHQMCAIPCIDVV